MRTNPGLWKRLCAHRFDAAKGTAPYSVKLAQTEGWSAQDAARVIEEYRRFLYLARARGLDPVPPQPIDTAWKIHLTYSRNYWDALVPDVLGRPLHRHALAQSDTARRKAAFGALTSAYEEDFGAPPPPDIWVDPARKTWGHWVAILMFGGVAGGFAAFGLMFLVAALVGIETGDGTVDTSVERAGAALFMLCWAAAFFSPLWAWLLTRGHPRLKSSKRARPTTEIGISFGDGD
ncbi:MAG: hypothetical protein AAFX45_03025 [Pseudomonadota bacterium]